MHQVKVPQFRLNTGQHIPAVGIGYGSLSNLLLFLNSHGRCWMGRVGEGEHVVQMVKDALELGYRHIDTVRGIVHYKISFDSNS